jgi:hypothetical protein
LWVTFRSINCHMALSAMNYVFVNYYTSCKQQISYIIIKCGLVQVLCQNINQVWETYYPTTLISLLYWVSNCPGNMPKYYPGNIPKYYSTNYHYRSLHEV